MNSFTAVEENLNQGRVLEWCTILFILVGNLETKLFEVINVFLVWLNVLFRIGQ